MRNMRTTIFVLLIIFEVTKCSRILLVFHTSGRSHYILGHALAKGLAEAGHDVTMVSPFENKNPSKNGSYKDVVLNFLDIEKNLQKHRSKLLDMESMNPFLMIPMINFFGNSATQNAFDSPNFQELLQSNEQFDVVIIEQFNNDALKVLAYHYKAPLIMFSTIGANGRINSLVGNPSPPSYVPEFFLGYTNNMTFWQRIANWMFALLSELNRQLIFLPAQNKMMHQYFPDAPDLREINYNISLVLLNSHESISQAVPHVPNMIDIGGFHVDAPKELSKDLKDFMDNATEGVVYFSMGSNIKPSQITLEQKQILIRTFSKLKQKVLWKWDESTLDGKPDNVKLAKWLPQPDILAHPNTKVFITHGGLLSTIETVYHGVPILAFPIFADQKMNAARAETDGYGMVIKFSHLTEEELTYALDKLINDPKFRDNVKKRSELMHDRPMKPMDLAVYWTEFVIRHKGAPHLRVAGVDLPWYIYLSLDVILFVIIITFGSLFSLYLLIRKLLPFKKGKNTTVKVKKN